MVLALVLGLLLARTLTLPLRALTRASQGIARGELEQQVKVTSQDEIGQLARAFNRMSLEVARVNLLRKQMTADIAHDLRTPLTVIAGYIESMRDGVLAPTTERLALIYAEIERLQTMVGDLRMLSQADAGELALNPQSVSPAALLERSATLFQHKAEQQGVTLSVAAPADVPDILVDEARLMQVLDNLLSNALRFTPAGGKIRLAARAEKDRLILTVKDTGSGIAPEELPSIFDRFYRAEKSRHAEAGESGLGLAIVKALVEVHGGRVWAESPPGEGATIFLEFPIIRG
jgi:signal transduction histidine kinase